MGYGPFTFTFIETNEMKQLAKQQVPFLDIFLGSEFQKDPLENVGAVGVEILAFPLTRHIVYTTACC